MAFMAIIYLVFFKEDGVATPSAFQASTKLQLPQNAILELSDHACLAEVTS
jgi:hypothetical protein